MFYVDDGCHSEGGNSASDDFPGTYKSINFEAGVRCCDNYGTSCITVGHCLDNRTTYYDAVLQCKHENRRLCTKDELLNTKKSNDATKEICCDTGGHCDDHPVWTSTQGECKNFIR